MNAKPAIAAVPPPDKPRRKSRLTQADRELLKSLRVIIGEYADGPVILKRRAELRVIADLAISKFFAAKVAGR